MMYQLYQAQADLMLPLRQFARLGANLTDWTGFGFCTSPMLRQFAASLTMFADAGLTHQRPEFGIDMTQVNNRSVAVTEVAADDTPFGTLLHFRKDSDVVQPRVLLVAPMSGHF